MLLTHPFLLLCCAGLYVLRGLLVVRYRPGIGDKPTVVGTNKFPPGTEASLDIQYIMSVGAKVCL